MTEITKDNESTKEPGAGETVFMLARGLVRVSVKDGELTITEITGTCLAALPYATNTIKIVVVER